jgi:hypothetical protein
MKSEAEQAYYGAKTRSQDTMQELSDRFSGIDKERLERIKELATARGTAFEKYTSDLNANEQKSFWSHIINGLGKILVGGYDIMSGPKTAAASQYYKGPDAFDLQGANATAKQKYDAEIKNIESIEADKQAADQNFMDTKIALANMQRGMSKDVYEMVTNLMDLTSTMNKAGYSSAFITPGMIQLLMDERDFNMRKLMYEELQKNARAKLEADQKTVTAGIVAKGQKTVQAQNTEQKTNYEQDTPRYAQDKKSVNTLLAYKHLIPSGLMGVTEVAETKAAADAFRANPNNETFTAYKSALEQKYAPQYKIGIETLQTRGKIDANTAREMGDGLDMAIRSFTPERAIRHPLYSGIDGLNAMPSWIEEQVNDKSPTGYYNKLSGSSVLGSSNRQEESISRKGSAAPKEQPPAAPATPTSGSESGTPAVQPTSAAATATAIPPTPAPLTTAKPANTGTPKPGGTPKVVEPKSVKTQAPAKQTAKPAPTAQQKPTTPPTPQAAQAEIDLLTSWLDKFNADMAAGKKPNPQEKAKFKEYYEKWKRLKSMK